MSNPPPYSSLNNNYYLQSIAYDDSLLIYLPMDKTIFFVRLYIHPVSIIKFISLFIASQSAKRRIPYDRLFFSCLQ